MSDNRLYSVGNRLQDKRKLWDRFVEGELDAWEQIFNQYYEDLYGYGIKFSSQRELTKDCIHELFVKLWERKEHLANVDSIKAYLLASLRRSLHKKLKKQRKYYSENTIKMKKIRLNVPQRFSFLPRSY